MGSRGRGTERRTFPSPGHCIYCNATENLTDEHILPLGLGGNYIFSNASCRRCAQETGRFEQRVLRGTMWPTRIRQRIQSRRPTPTTLPVYVSDETPGPIRRLEVAASAVPEHMILLQLPQPSILFGQPPEPKSLVHAKVAIYEGPEFRDAVQALGRRNLYARAPTPSDLCRLLARIGHAFAVADRASLPEFSPLLCELILGRDEVIPTHYVGCMRDTPPDPEPNVTHRIHSQWIEAPTGNYLLANIRLFANIGAPEYSVVVGQLTDKPAKAS